MVGLKKVTPVTCLGTNKAGRKDACKPVGYDCKPVGYDWKPVGYDWKPIGYDWKPIGHYWKLVGLNLQFV